MAPPFGEPDWATPGDTSNTVTTTQAPAVSQPTITNNSTSEQRTGSAGCTLVLLSFFNMLLAAAMGTLGILTLLKFKPSKVKDYTLAFLSTYMVIFGILLFLYEFIWWQPVASLNRMFRKNFGFMYGLRGKGFYLIFIAFLCLGLRDNKNVPVKGLDWVTGIGWLVGGVAHVAIAMCWPQVAEKYKPPTAGLSRLGDGTDVV